MSNVMVEMTPYFQRVRNRMRCPRKYQDEQLKKIIRAAEEYVLENPNATPEEAEEYLGKPEEIAQELMESIDPKVLERDRKRKRIGILLVIGILTAALLTASALLIYFKITPPESIIVEKITIYAEGSGPT